MTGYIDPGEDEGRRKPKPPVKDSETGDLFGPPAPLAPAKDHTGWKRKEKALDDHDEHKREAIQWLRRQLAELHRSRSSTFPPSPWVSVDDARRLYDESNFPAAYSENRTFFGSVFRGKDWEVVGRMQSTHPSNNARSVCRYRYVG